MSSGAVGCTIVWGSAAAKREAMPSLADLVAYRGLVDAAREWPFDASTVRRFGLYMLIPLGSWLGGALVERLMFLETDLESLQRGLENGESTDPRDLFQAVNSCLLCVLAHYDG